MNRFLFILFVCILLSCRNNNKDSLDPSIISLEIEILPSFGERAKFKITAESVSAIIEENWRLSASTNKPADTMYFYSSPDEVDFKGWKDAIQELPKDSSEYHSNCRNVDGWSIKGQISFDDNTAIGLNYQCCEADTVAHKLTESLLKQLSSAFVSDTIVEDYLYDIYYSYFLGQEPPIDSAEYINRPLTKMRIEVFEKYYKK